MKRLAIEIRQAAANAAQEERAMPFAFHRGACFLQEARGEHGAKCERDHGGKKNRNCQHEAEFAEQAARLPRQEGNRHENGSKRKRGGDDGEEHFLRTEHGCGARPHALIAAAHHVFQNHDGIIHHEARGKYQRQKREDIDREAHQIDRRNGADQGGRHGERGDQCRAHPTET